MKEFRKNSEILKAAQRMLKPTNLRIETKVGIDDKGFAFSFKAVVWNDEETGKEQFIGTQFIN